MRFELSREQLLEPLQFIANVVEKRQTMPILANVLIKAADSGLTLIGTDNEIECTAHAKLASLTQAGSATVPAKKLLDICKALPADAKVVCECEAERFLVKSGRSRFVLNTLPASEFPHIEVASENTLELPVEAALLKDMIDKSAFSMALQDVRFYLNGMLLSLSEGNLVLVATDGHRLAYASAPGIALGEAGERNLQLIMPRKAVNELARLLSYFDNDQQSVTLRLGEKHVTVLAEDMTFVTKLIDAKFPDYGRVIPEPGQRVLRGQSEVWREAFNRVAILSTDKFRGVKLAVEAQRIKLFVNNPEQEEAVEEIACDYAGEPFEVGFNINYLTDVLQSIGTQPLVMSFSDANDSALIQAEGEQDALYVVMPIRI